MEFGVGADYDEDILARRTVSQYTVSSISDRSIATSHANLDDSATLEV